MKKFYPVKLQKAVDSLFTSRGTVTPALRQAVEAYAAKRSGGERETQPIPAEIVSYVDKVIFHAYQVTDEDVQQLIKDGYSEDAIFEITLSASVGASLARLERGMQALEASHALTNS